MAADLLSHLEGDVSVFVRETLDELDTEDDDAVDALTELLAAHLPTFSEQDIRCKVCAAAASPTVSTATVIVAAAAPATARACARACAPAHAPASDAPPSTSRPQPYASTGQFAPTTICGSDQSGGLPLAMLREVVPQASAELCARVFHEHADDVEATLDVLLNSDIEALQRELEASIRHAEKEAALAMKRERRRVLNRYDDERDYTADGHGPPKLAPPRLPYASSRKEAIRGPAVRYLAGEVVSYKGEKAVARQVKEEWDGGSRGRIKTKGKRGPGFS